MALRRWVLILSGPSAWYLVCHCAYVMWNVFLFWYKDQPPPRAAVPQFQKPNAKTKARFIPNLAYSLTTF